MNRADHPSHPFDRPGMSEPHNTYICDKHLVSIHSHDRDISKYPSTSSFEVTLPQEMRNVETVGLSEIVLPVNHHTFSTRNQNTRFRFYVDVGGTVDTTGTMISIQSGFYLPVDLAQEIENRMNLAVQTTSEYGDPTYNRFHVMYNEVGHAMEFGNSRDQFRIAFADVSNIDLYSTTEKGWSPETAKEPIFSRYVDWGLGSFLGFEKLDYTADPIIANPHFFHLGKYVSDTTNATKWFDIEGGTGYRLTAPNATNFHGDNTVYMEIDRLNSMDELIPYPDISRSTGYSTRENRYATTTHIGGRPNACFAKIPLTNSPHSQVFDSKNGFLSNTTHYNPPIERIAKLKVRFRSHDGTPIDFRNSPVTFTLEFHCIRNEIRRDADVRTPSRW
jgi:hypothetical protein